ncbi:MAG: hypothetical protein JST54_33860 [Deltaproteobacteria bacterium]|nr:hypothetical protein [Deltaproteobacteria bacterium]
MHPTGGAQPRSRSPPSGQVGVTQLPFTHSPGAQHVALGPQCPPKSTQQLGALANSYAPQISPGQHEPSAHCASSPRQAEPVEPPVPAPLEPVEELVPVAPLEAPFVQYSFERKPFAARNPSTLVEVISMILPLTLLILMGSIGSIDSLYFHLYRFRLYAQPSSRIETLTHVVRGLTFCATLSILLAGVPRGAWYWAVAAVFGVDFVDDVVDVLIEPGSRRPLGGLPPAEYLIHMVVMAVTGAIWVSFLTAGWATRNAPTALEPWAGTLPGWMVWDARLMAAGGAGLALLELGLMWHAARRPVLAT